MVCRRPLAGAVQGWLHPPHLQALSGRSHVARRFVAYARARCAPRSARILAPSSPARRERKKGCSRCSWAWQSLAGLTS